MIFASALFLAMGIVFYASSSYLPVLYGWGVGLIILGLTLPIIVSMVKEGKKI